MEYIYLALACTLFSVQFIFTKSFSRRASAAPHVGLWNGVLISALMVCYLLPLNGFAFEFSGAALLYGLLYVGCAVTMNLCNIPAMRLGNMAVVTTYMLIGGMVLPFGYGVLMLGEPCPPLKLIAIAVLIAAIIPNVLPKGGKGAAAEKDTGTRSVGKILLFHGLCLILFTFNGSISIVTKAHSIHADAISSGAFTMLCAVIQLVISALLLVVYATARRIKGERGAFRSVFWDVTRESPATGKKLLVLAGFGLGYAVCNGVANIFSQECARIMDASIQFPMISASVIVLTAIFGRIFFGERIDRYSAISLVLSVVGAVLFMVA
ncbi:MAG: hypothetical protein IJW40_01675 [Clostridia bacterium]|nr:hypothetical protein [Clostridia bacterium]